ncbi:hypothetical protein FGF66_00095 [Chlorobaculum thiosulfatiphilum]|uniref:Reverse transcriptase domain-containing protein n=1 Tax=Chlorobaculum thiosulfatiphilum TaxID=115852 RepID=A0A5C4S9G8_CHLTI|nr:reverse transcriptase domain-containing protein [Chlorobaculum thiosulfatiphilum]TNJ40213.1 hypothetical protein FGF66_00095 [Chlorobaculum thiosulfatiphilum]
MNRYIEPIEFVKSIDKAFWGYITKQSLIKDVVDFKDLTKDEYLYEIARKINGGVYRPSVARLIGYPKGFGVIRPVMHFDLTDVVVYYYCVKSLQDQLIERINEVEFVYGGFRLTDKLVLSESSMDGFVYDPSYEMFLKCSFRKAWSDYQNLAQGLYENRFDYYMHLDIAHFYDSIPLNKLEQEVRSLVPNKKNDIDLLFYLLKNVKTIDNYSYTENVVGLPQEEVGEISRLLANFYLNYFDVRIIDELKCLLGDSKGRDWQYTRYADDLWFAFRGDKNISLRITQIVSRLLSDLSLHLNDSKTRIMNADQYFEYWCFSDWDFIDQYGDDKEELFAKIKDLYCKRQNGCRWFSPFNYILKMIISLNRSGDILIKRNMDFFFEVMIDHPELVNRNNGSLINLMAMLMRSRDDFKKRLIEYLSGSDVIYPLVSFVYWNACLKLPYSDDVYRALLTRYYSEKWRDLWWYERCLFLRYYIDNKVYDVDASGLAKLLNHFENRVEYMSDYERRYVIRLLMRLPDQKGLDLLKRKYSENKDKRLIEYLRK